MSDSIESKLPISRIRRTPRAPVKPTPSQLPYALGLIVILVAFGAFLGSAQLVFVWIVAVLHPFLKLPALADDRALEFGLHGRYLRSVGCV